MRYIRTFNLDLVWQSYFLPMATVKILYEDTTWTINLKGEFSQNLAGCPALFCSHNLFILLKNKEVEEDD